MQNAKQNLPKSRSAGKTQKKEPLVLYDFSYPKTTEENQLVDRSENRTCVKNSCTVTKNISSLTIFTLNKIRKTKIFDINNNYQN